MKISNISECRKLPAIIEGRKLPKKFNTSYDIAYFMLVIARVILLHLTDEPSEKEIDTISTPYMKLSQRESFGTRLFVFCGKNKFYTMKFPCRLMRENDGALKMAMQIKKRLYLNSKNLSDAISLIEDLRSCKKLSFNDAVLDELYPSETYDIVEAFLTEELIYARYDYDTVSKISKAHPQSHFDIGLISKGHFKLGLTKKLNAGMFEDAFDLDLPCCHFDMGQMRKQTLKNIRNKHRRK